MREVHDRAPRRQGVGGGPGGGGHDHPVGVEHTDRLAVDDDASRSMAWLASRWSTTSFSPS